MKKVLLLLLGLSLFIVGCDDDDSPSGPTTSSLEINIAGLEDLGSTAMYEGWIMVDGGPKTTGTFSVDASGTPSQSSFDIDNNDLSSATAFILTISGKYILATPTNGSDTDEKSGIWFLDLSPGGTAVISIEPDPDNSPNPFTLKPLAIMIPSYATDHFTYSMDKNLSSFPTGTATK